MLPLKGIIFLALNAVRLLSIVALLLVFSAVVLLIAQDAKAYQALAKAGELNLYTDDWCYYPDSDVPTTTWGLFWLQLDRFIILCIALLCVASEVSFGPLNRLFVYCLPILGASFSTAPLGVIQMMMSASLLSHYQEGLPLVAAWLLFFVGLFNVLLGVVLRSRLKMRRSLFRSKRQAVSKLDVEGRGAFDPAKKTVWTLAKTPLDAATKSKEKASLQERESLLAVAPTKPIRTPLDAFPTAAHATCQGEMTERKTTGMSATSEMLRKRARHENWRIEKEQEEREGTKSGLRRLEEEFQWDRVRDVPIPRPDSTSLQWQIKQGQAGASRDLSRVNGPEEAGMRAAFQRRSLVLSRMVQQVKRGSGAAKKRRRMSKVPAMPNRYARQRLTPTQAPSAWVEVKKSAPPPHPPSPAYRPDRATVYEDLGNDGTRTRYHSFTPIADKFTWFHAR